MRFFKKAKSESADVAAAKARYTELIEQFDELIAHPDDVNAVVEWIDRIGEFRKTAPLTPDDLALWDQSAFEAVADFILSDESVSAGITETDVGILGRVESTVELSSTEAGSRMLALYARFYRIGCANGGLLARTSDAVLMTHPDEDVFYEGSIELLKESVQREFRGGGAGFSFRVAKGVRFHTGQFRGHSVVTGTELQVADHGSLSVTSQRIVFLGQRKTFEVACTKVLSMDMFEDGIRFHVSGRQDAPLFKTYESEVIGAVINAVVQGEYTVI